MIPDVGAQLWMEFEEGNANKPIWTGTFWRASDMPPEDAQKPAPTTRMLQTASGHRLQFDDESGEERITLAHTGGSNLVMEPDGNLVLTNEADATLTLDSVASKCELTVKCSS